MKIKELQKTFQNKFTIRMLAGVLVVAMAGGSFAAGYMRGTTEQAITAAERAETALGAGTGHLPSRSP
mgnify:CR=1 FL=1